MNVFALADLHLDGGHDKPMHVFGDKWMNHASKIESAWRDMVSSEDIVLIPGDISWAERLDEVIEDINWISSLPGTKVLSRGNHDYWWSSTAKMKDRFPDDIKIIKNDSIAIDGIVFAGTRGWRHPLSVEFVQSKDEKIYKRELLRLQLTLSSASKRIANGEGDTVVLLMHFPPIDSNGEETGFTELISSYPEVTDVVYGHLHAQATMRAFEGEHNGKNYRLCSADHLNFCPLLIR